MYRTLSSVSIAILLTVPACQRAATGAHEDPNTGTESRDSAESHGAAMTEHASTVLVPVGNSGVRGTLEFERTGGTVHIRGRIRGLSPGKHGFHVHEFGDLSDRESGASAGGHFAPHGMPHGRPADGKRHVGDLGNIEADASGVAEIDIEDARIQLVGPHSIVGRAVVVHAGEDTFTQPSGGAGARVAFGTVGIAGADG